MENIKNVLILCGSPKVNNSTSLVLAKEFAGSLKNTKISSLNILEEMEKEDEIQRMRKSFIEADIIVLTTPLYVDQLPAHMIKWMEQALEYKLNKKQRLVSIINCGFPESAQNKYAEEICRNFAEYLGINYAGGFLVGGGGALDGKELEKMGGLTRNIRMGLKMGAENINNEEKISYEAVMITGKQVIPAFIYILLGSIQWKLTAKKNKVEKKLYAKPYESR